MILRFTTSLFAACHLFLEAASAPTTTGVTLKVGGPIQRTGKYAQYGNNAETAFKIWADWVNSRTLGYTIRLNFQDDQSNSNTAKDIATRMARSNEVDIMVAPYTSAASLKVVQAVNGSKITMVWGGSSSSVFSTGLAKVFGTLTVSEQYMSTGLSRLFALGARTLILVKNHRYFSASVCNGALTIAKDLGMTAMGYYTVADDGSDVKTVLELHHHTPATSDADVLVGCGHFVDMMTLVKALPNITLKVKAILATHVCTSSFQNVLKASTETANLACGLLMPTQWVHTMSPTADPVTHWSSTDFVSMFMARTGSTPSYQTASAFAAAIAISNGIYQAGGANDLNAVAAKMADLDVDTFYGRLRFGMGGRMHTSAGKPMYTVQERASGLQRVAPPGGTSVPLSYPADDITCQASSSSPLVLNACSASFYMPSASRTSCLPCQPGFYCPSSTSELQMKTLFQCSIGHWCPQGSAVPQKCPEGMYSDMVGARRCNTCPVGKTTFGNNRIHMNACESCPVGEHWVARTCNACPSGKFNDIEGSTECKQCKTWIFLLDVNDSKTECQLDLGWLCALISIALCLLFLSCSIWRKMRTKAEDRPDRDGSRTAAWVIEWIGHHKQKQLKPCMQTSSFRMGRQKLTSLRNCTPWIINATPWEIDAALTINATPSWRVSHRLPPYSFCGTTRASAAKVAVTVRQGVDSASEVNYSVAGSDWTVVLKSDDSPSHRSKTGILTRHFKSKTWIHRHSLPSGNGHDYASGDIKMVYRCKASWGRARTLLLITWSPPSILRGILVPEFDAFLGKVITDGGDWKGKAGKDRNMYDAAKILVRKEATRFDASYAEIRTDFGPSNIFVSHVWGETAANTRISIARLHEMFDCKDSAELRSMSRISRSNQRNRISGASDSSSQTISVQYLRIWFCTTCNNQARIGEELGADVRHSSFAQVLRSPSCAFVVMINPLKALERKWCNYEFCLAAQLGKEALLLTQDGVIQAGQVPPRALSDVSAKMATFRCADARCSSKTDQTMIDNAVAELGGYQVIDSKLKHIFQEAIADAQNWVQRARDGLTETPGQDNQPSEMDSMELGQFNDDELTYHPVLLGGTAESAAKNSFLLPL